MNTPRELRYARTHEWIRMEGELARVGITDYAQEQLGDIVFVELPPVGETFEREAEIATVESVKAASPIYCPLSGEVTEVNGELEKQPELLNKDPYGAFLFVLRVAEPSQAEELLDAEAYEAVVEQELKKH
jgi:glycine cleavage system H protein